MPEHLKVPARQGRCQDNDFAEVKAENDQMAAKEKNEAAGQDLELSDYKKFS